MSTRIPSLTIVAVGAFLLVNARDSLAADPDCSATATAATEAELVVAEILPVTVDSKTGSGKTWIQVRNQSKEDKEVTLKAGGFVDTLSKKTLNAESTLMGAAETTGSPIMVACVKAGKTLQAKLLVNSYTTAGTASGKIDINDKAYTIQASLLDVPFKLTLQSATPDKPKLELAEDQDALITLKNDDTTSYLVSWCLFLQNSADVVGGTERVAAMSSVPVRFVPPHTWYRRYFQGLFKNDLRDGTVTLRFTLDEKFDPACPPRKRRDEKSEASATEPKTSPIVAPAASPLSKVTLLDSFPARTIPVQLELARHDWWGELAGNGVLIFVLVIGAILSMVLHWWIPNFSRRADLGSRLDALLLDIRLLEKETDSRLRVITRVQRLQLVDKVKSLFIPSLDAADRLAEFEKEADMQSKRVILCLELDEVRRELVDIRTQPLAAALSILDKAASDLSAAADVLCKPALTDVDFTSAKSLIDGARRALLDVGKDNTELATRLAARANELKTDFETGKGPVAITNTGKKFAGSNGGLFQFLLDSANLNATTIAASNYGPLEVSVMQLTVLRDYIRHAEGIASSANDVDGTRLVAMFTPMLVDELRKCSAASVSRARCIVSQLSERITMEDITKALRNKAVSVGWDPLVAKPDVPIRMQVRFHDLALQNSAARNAFTCKWHFVPAVGTETGWDIAHYFRAKSKVKWRAWLIAKLRARAKEDPPVVNAEVPAKSETELPHQPETAFLVTFVDHEGKNVTAADGSSTLLILKPNRTPELDKADPLPISDKSKAEFLRLCLAMGIAIIGLIAGARDQFMKLDVFFGLLAVLTLGFSADTIKNLFVKKP